jgi:type IV pilus assembly protein PilE
MRGFTLIELLLAMAIVGILATIALPSFEHYRLRGVQTEAMATLERLAQLQARLRLERGTYETAPALSALEGLPTRVADHYRLSVDIDTDGTAYILRLIPRVRRDGDPALSLDHAGRRHPQDVWF